MRSDEFQAGRLGYTQDLSVQMGARYSAGTKKAADKVTKQAFKQSNRLDWKPDVTPVERKQVRDVHVQAANVHRAAQADAAAAGKPAAADYHRGWAGHHELTAAKYHK